MVRFNPLLNTDGYKVTHWKQYPKGTRYVHSYMESRGGMFPATQMAGLQQKLMDVYEGQFFTRQDINEAEDYAERYFGQPGLFNRAGWEHILNKHGGKLPLRIKAIPEGHLVDTHNALITVENMDPAVPWLPNWTETDLLRVWYPITVGTLSRAIRQVIGKSLVKTGSIEGLPFKLHDFGFRGVSSAESAAIGGFAHLINFQGTDTMNANEIAAQFYGHPMAGFSIPASEHSTITSWGGPKFERQAMENMLDKYPTGLVACVSDSYDLANAVNNIWGTELRDKIVSRQGTLVVRPDSGDPLTVILQTFNGLWEKFGGETNSKGYRVLAPSVRVIQGDGVNYHSINQIVRGINEAGWSMDNLAFGMGGALLQSINRDTLRFAFKASAINIDGKWNPVYKNPKTDPTKASKAGRFEVHKIGKFVTITKDENPVYIDSHPADVLETVFLNGVVFNKKTLQQIRKTAESYDEF